MVFPPFFSHFVFFAPLAALWIFFSFGVGVSVGWLYIEVLGMKGGKGYRFGWVEIQVSFLGLGWVGLVWLIRSGGNLGGLGRWDQGARVGVRGRVMAKRGLQGYR
jgi:hypothetical protein